MNEKELKEKFLKMEKQLKEDCLDIYNFIWNYQEGQPEHFDKLNKTEKVEIIDIFSKARSLYSALEAYHHWFIDEK